MGKTSEAIKDAILERTRLEICKASANDSDAWFEINRWVYSRLQLDEHRRSQTKGTAG